MHLRIEHSTHYTYNQPVTLQDHRLLLTPRASQEVTLWRGDLDEKFPSIRMRTDRRGFQVVPALIDAGKRYSQV